METTEMTDTDLKCINTAAILEAPHRAHLDVRAGANQKMTAHALAGRQ